MITSLHKFIAARKRSLGQGNIFTRVCHSVQGSGSVEGGGLCLGGRGVSVTVTYGTVKSGRYTTYWNAFLFEKEISDHTNKTSRILNGADSA